MTRGRFGQVPQGGVGDEVHRVRGARARGRGPGTSGVRPGRRGRGAVVSAATVRYRPRSADNSRGCVRGRSYCVPMTIVEHPSREKVRAHRDAILESLGLTRKQLEERAHAGELVGEEWVAWAEVEELGYLLGDDD